jgi:imidazolonepropionase-like amidohydrolase
MKPQLTKIRQAALAASLALAGAALAAGDPESWNEALPAQPEAILVRHATIWTSGPQGRLEDADLLVRKGVIAAVGRGLDAPAGALIVDATGKHVTAGLIDAHSHTAITGGVNEGTNITTAEVRIGDVLDPGDIAMYRELAGGLTSANLLHGSANSIGGQNQVIKLRWGAGPEGLRFAGAPPGIKFALGENPKQSNWGVERKRFPQSRQGVEESIRERFVAARDYRRRWDEYRRRGDKNEVPPRRDLQLEALVEILDGKRLVHAHSYRADEILMLLDVAASFGFRVATFQHVLEGYKVAAEIAAHGAGASTFSDWWAYKYEVIDAIPWNGAIMQRRGVVVSYNSDSDELARRLNLEAAKAVRYGNLPEEEALDFVTINPARQLHIDQRVGSLEPGKDADFVVWNGHPLSTYTLCEQTWIDGRKYFDRAADLARRAEIATERRALLDKLDKPEAKKDEEDKDKKDTDKPAPVAQEATRENR